MSPMSPLPSDLEITLQQIQPTGVRGETGEGSTELHFEGGDAKWNCADLTNLVIFVQLLNHERSFLAQTGSYLRNLTLSGTGRKPISYFAESADKLSAWLEQLVKRIRQVLYDRQHSGILPMADRILCENAHEALGEELIIPRQSAISEESLARLPLGMQICHLIRRLKLDIQDHGFCDFKPLANLVSQLHDQWTTRHTSFALGPDYVFQLKPKLFLYPASISLVVAEDFKQHVVRNWVRNVIANESSSDNGVFFPIRKVTEIWNAADDSVDCFHLSHLIDVEAADSELHSLLHAAVLCDKPRIVRALVDHNPNQVCKRTRAGFNAFHHAASVGSVDCYHELLKCNKSKTPQRIPGDGRQLPLHIAARNGHKEMVDYMLAAHSEDQQFINARNRKFETPLMLAAESGSLDVVRSLLAHPRINLTLGDVQGRTALIHAGENSDIARLIISKLPSEYFNTLHKDVTPLHSLAKFAGYDLMQLVLSAPSIRPDETDNGDTPLCEAVRAGNVEAVKALGIRRDVDVKRLCQAYDSGDRLIRTTRKRVREADDNWSQILDWLKRNCIELEADLRDWKSSTSVPPRNVSNPLCPRGPSSNKNTSLIPPQANAQPTYTCSPQPPHQHSQLSNPPPYQYSHQNPPQPVQEDKSSRVGIIGATTGGLTAHLLGGGILSTIGGAMAGAAGGKKISEYAQALPPDWD
ncbi:Ankycorbin [Colletotrichum siamense]|nr:Ankycorbin [Colletotrichum siamense]